MITNSFDEELDLVVASVNPRQISAENSAKLLNGDWFIQKIGQVAEKLDIKVVCSWTVLNELFGYADTKEKLEVTYLDFVKSGHIIGQVDYEIFSKGGVQRLYTAIFELAVIPDV